MMRAAAKAVLRLYPKAWRERYGEEVGDLIAARPIRLRTVVDLMRGAADAWLNHRRIPQAGAAEIPVTAALTVAGVVLLLLWNLGMRDVASLHDAWAEAESTRLAATLRGMAMAWFAVAGAWCLLSVVPLLVTCHTAMRRSPYGPGTRMTARLVVVTAVALALPIALMGLNVVALSFADTGYSAGPLGDAMAGGFHIPIVLALLLPLPLTAAAAPSLGSSARDAGRMLAVAAMVNALAWLPVGALLVLGLEKASWTFVAAVAAGALVSVGMAAFAARAALKAGRAALDRLAVERGGDGPVQVA